jgi:hypothetical protein
MKTLRLLLVCALWMILHVAATQAQEIPCKDVTILDVQMVPADSLRTMDSLVAISTTALNTRPKADDSPHLGDTVCVTGVVISPARVITNVGARYSTYIQDTSGQIWAGVNVLTNDTSTAAQATHLQDADSGWVITIKGTVAEFQSGSNANSTTEIFAYTATASSGAPAFSGAPIGIVRFGGSRPAPIEVHVSDFATGTTPKFSTGEKLEGMYVIIRNVVINAYSSQSPAGTSWSFTDADGNVMFEFDASKYWTLRGHGNGTYSAPPVGTFIEYIRGIVGGFGSGYAILPLYPGDVKYGVAPPVIKTASISRLPVTPSPTDAVNLRVPIIDLNSGGQIDSASVYYQVNFGDYQKLTMSKANDTLWTATVPAQADTSIVSYYVVAFNNQGKTTVYPDTSKLPRLFYRVLNRPPKIVDLQYTPYRDGISGYNNLVTGVVGIVTADTSDMPGRRSNSPARPRVFIQDGQGPWTGIWVSGSLAYSLHRGDSVYVRGKVQETFTWQGTTAVQVNATNIQADSVFVRASGISPPAPVYILTDSLSRRANGDPRGEQWEGVLVEVHSITVTDTLPDTPSNFGEYVVDDGSGPLRVDDDGNNTYSVYRTAQGPEPGTTRLDLGSTMSKLVGILDYTFGNYKLEPRKNSDFFDVVTSVEKDQIAGAIPATYSLSQNYPNPFNPSTTIEYDLPEAAHVTLKVYNLLGQEVMTLVNEQQQAGKQRVRWGVEKLASGVYFYRLDAGKFIQVKKMVLLK